MEFAINPTTLTIATLTFTAVVCIGGAVIAAGSAQRDALESRLRAQPPELPGQRRKHQSGLGKAFGKLGTLVSPKGASSGLQKRMSQAGYFSPAAGAVFIGVKLALLAGSVAGVMLLATLVEGPLFIKAFGAIFIVGTAFFLPNFYLSWQISQRTGEIRRHLPDAVDLLEICVSGGMGLDQAWNAVEEQVRPVCPALADEIALTNLEMHLGAERGVAMRHMADRTGAEELNSLVAVLVQSERFGTSLTEALRVFTASLRDLRSQRAEESAEKMAVKMIFPMVILIFPVILIIAVGPAGITLAELLGGN